jgi:hypothetical protein
VHRFFYQIQFHRQLANLALKGGNLRFILGHRTGCSLLGIELATIVLGKPQLDQIRRYLVSLLGFTAPKLAIPDIGTKL